MTDPNKRTKAQLKNLGIRTAGQLRSKGVEMPEDAQVAIVSCWGCYSPGAKKCSVCKARRYCSVECQTEDWTRHKLECSMFREHGVKVLSMSVGEENEMLTKSSKYRTYAFRAEDPNEIAELMEMRSRLGVDYPGMGVGVTIPANFDTVEEWLDLCYPGHD